MRHRTASINELSARYSVVPREYYEPEILRGQSQVNHQGSEGVVEVDKYIIDKVSNHLSDVFTTYEEMLEQGCCREQSRGILPQSTYTEFYWKINLHNLLHYLQLRMDSHAQKEIQDYANAIYKLVEPLVPHTMEAFMDFRVNGMHLTAQEIEAIKTGIQIESPGERREFEEKLKRLKINNEVL